MPHDTVSSASSLLVPDIIHRPSEARRLAAAAGAATDELGARPRALNPAMRHVRMSLKDVLVIDNRDLGRGDIYLVTLVTDNLGPEPIELSVKTFNDIAKDQHLTLGPAGLAMYRRSAPLPSFLDYRILIAESDQELRDAGAILDDVRADATFKSFRDTLITVAGAPAPAAALATAAADFTMQLVARILKANRDDQLMYIAGSFDDAFDNLGVPLGVVTHRNTFAEVKYVVEAAG
jgi:hypothetical protein